MKRKLLFVKIAIGLLASQLHAQTPILQEKETLPTQLKNNLAFNNASQVDTVLIPFTSSQNMSLEVKATITSATGRGLDVDFRKEDFTGFRTSANTSEFQWSAPLTSSYMLNFSSSQEQTIRYAIEGTKVHIYQNGTYIDSKDFTSIYNIENGQENTNPDISNLTSGPNITENAFGNLSTQTPSDAGWSNNGAGAVPWNSPNSGSGVRFINSLNNQLTYNGSTYTENTYFMMMRWESGVTNGSAYYYPVTLEANTTYNLNFLHTYWGNGTSGTFNVAVSQENTSQNIIAETNSTFATNDNKKLIYKNLSFTTTTAGTYYILFKNNGEGIWFTGSLNLKKLEASPRIIVGKNYTDGAVNMQVASITFDSSGAYAPVSISNAPKTPVSIQDENYQIERFINADVTISGNSEIHLTASDALRNSSINLTSNNAWLYLESIQPSTFLNEENDWLDNIKINGSTFNPQTDRVAIYGSGCVIIPNGKTTEQNALTVYSEENFGGDSQSYEIHTYHNDLGNFNNNIKSFKLKKGFAVTFANNSNGTGFSKMYIANDEDLNITSMPEGFVASATNNQSFISFIRVFKWQWSSKKGTAGRLGGTANDQANASIVYDWSAGGTTENPDVLYVPMRHNLGWDSFSTINSRSNVTHVLGYNEPARPDQANMTVASAITQWPELFKSGLRIGSPAPASITSSWLNEFMSICDLLNYRVDFVAFHAYQDQNTGWWDWNIGAASIGNRPVWITEWNNGANWTNSADASKWPDNTGTRVDVHGNPILDDGGNEQTVSLPLTAANAERQKNKLQEILTYFESNDLVEHHFLYNWVNDARTLELNGELTPAGEMFGNFKSEVGFKKANEYNHQWKVAPGWLSSNISSDYQSTSLTWYDHNGETGKSYIIERKANSEEEFTIVETVNINDDYEVGGTVTFNDPINYESATYRIKAVSYKDTESAYSHETNITIDQVADAPQLNAEALSAGIVQLSWNDAQGALTYNIYRANNSEGPFELIEEQYNYTPKDGEAETINIYKDENLSEATSYYYYITSVNSNPQSAASTTIPVTTLTISSPMAVENFHVSSGDNTVVLSWDFAYDVQYNIYRSTSENGTYTSIATNHSGTFYKDTNSLNNNETYFYKVEATNTKGTSPLSVALSATPKNGQHALFNFNENNGTVAFDQWGGYHAELKNNSQWTPANNGYAVSLSESNQSYIELGDNIVSSLTDFTIATWVKLSENTTWNRIFDFGDGTNKYLFLTSKSSGNTVRFGIKNNGDEVQINGDLTMNTDEWYHVAVTQNGLEGVLYVNGVAVGTNTNMTINPADLGSTSQNYLGKSQWPADPYTNHSYDDFRIYNYALAESDVLKLANNESLSNASLNHFNASLNVNPNPIERGQDLKITLENTVERATATLYNLAGSVITKQQIKAGINTMATPKNSGIYILEIRANNAVVNRKIIVK